MITKNIDVTIGGARAVEPIVSVSQYDTMWRFIFTPYYNTEPYCTGEVWTIPDGTGVTMQGMKPDGHAFAYAGTVSDNTAIVDCQEQMTTCNGNVACELVFTDSSDRRVGTANFVLKVERAPVQSDDILSDTETSTLRTWLNEAIDETNANKTAAANQATAAAKSATASASSATEAAEHEENAKQYAEQAAALGNIFYLDDEGCVMQY